jgi:hypothetical protein
VNRSILFLGIVAAIVGCSGLVIDPSAPAAASGDLTLALKACDGPLYSGFGVCRVKEGTEIDSSWQAVLPKLEGHLLGGELTVRLRDIVKSYPIPDGGIVNVPLRDLYGHGVWEKADTSIANATAKLRIKYDTGIEGELFIEGQILIRVLAEGYDPIAIDSGFHAWGRKCSVQYSTSGRGAVKCD